MELSNFIKIYTYPERPDHLLIFSTKNASKILIKKDLLNKIKNNNLDSDNKVYLTKAGIIVNSREEEKEEMLGFFSKLDLYDKTLNIIIHPNLDCNFACKYCYEGDMKGKLYMSEKTLLQLISFIKNKFTEDKDILQIDFHGGEPLLSTDLITSISKEMISFTKQRGATYLFNLITNGSLLKKELVERLEPLGLRSAKITIDGPSVIHNKSRPFKSGAGSFDILINNIKKSCDRIRFNIGGNYEKDNFHLFPQLLDYLLKEGLSPEKIAGIRFDPVFREQSTKAPMVDHSGGCMIFNAHWFFEASILLREEILKRGYNFHKIKPTRCLVNNKDAYTINYDGSIYKCPALIGKEIFKIGDVASGTTDYSITHNIDNWKNDECLECSYLPLCFGGCRYTTYGQYGNLDTIDCFKDFFDTTLERFILQDIQYLMRTQ